MDPTIGPLVRTGCGGYPRTALRMIGEDGADRSSSFVEMAARSDQLATSLATTGVAQRDRVMAMLGKHVALWKSMLAVTKVGAVIMPATTVLEPNDLTDQSGGRRCVMPSPMPTRSTNSLTSQGISTASRLAAHHVRGDRTGWPTQWPLRHGSPRGKRLALRHTDNWDSSRLSVESFWLCMDTTSRPSGYLGPSPAECGASFCGPRNQLCDN
jgi:non-ribosomal peptide synthetase component E (peptide arylation enzyme)